MARRILRNALLWDGVAPEPRDGIDLMLDGERIEEISESPLKAADALEIDLAGRMVMPGLIDAHFHAVAAQSDLGALDAMPRSLLYQHARKLLEAALQRGFTTVRDAGGADYGLAQAVESGLIAGPRIFFAGRALSQTGGHGDFRPFEGGNCCLCGQGTMTMTRVADGVDEVRKAARDELRKGAHQIKIMASGGVSSPSDPVWVLQYSEEEVRAIVWEATSWRTYVMAHAYTAESIYRSVDYGVRSIEHANLIDAETAVFCTERGAFVVPTLAAYEALHTHGREVGFPEFGLSKLSAVRDAGVRSLELLKAAGTKTGFGTDLLGELQRFQSTEFEIRAEVLTPWEILTSATVTNAELLNRSGQLGQVCVGALADLLVVEGNALEDVSLLGRPDETLAMIIKGGEIYKNTLS